MQHNGSIAQEAGEKNKIFEFIINSIFFVKIERGGTH